MSVSRRDPNETGMRHARRRGFVDVTRQRDDTILKVIDYDLRDERDVSTTFRATRTDANFDFAEADAKESIRQSVHGAARGNNNV